MLHCNIDTLGKDIPNACVAGLIVAGKPCLLYFQLAQDAAVNGRLLVIKTPKSFEATWCGDTSVVCIESDANLAVTGQTSLTLFATFGCPC